MYKWKPEAIEAALIEMKKKTSLLDIFYKSKSRSRKDMEDILNAAINGQGLVDRIRDLELSVNSFVMVEPFVKKPTMSCCWISNEAIDRAMVLLKGTPYEPYRGPSPFDALKESELK